MNRFQVLVTVIMVGVLCGTSWPVAAREKKTPAPPDLSRVFLKGVESYENGHYQAAAEKFLTVAENGVENGQLYYNLGNAYFKAGDLGRSILWYEKARQLMPHDPELAFNLDHARSRVKDRAPPENKVARAVFFWRYWLGQRTLIYLAIACSVVFFAGMFATRHLRKRVPPFLLYAVLTLGIVFTATAGFNYYALHTIRQGIVLPGSISVKSGFSDFSTELFVLHAGSRVTIEKQQKDFYRVRFGNDKIGWVEKKAIGVI